MLANFVYKSDAIRVVFGRGAIAQLGKSADVHKMSRVMVLCSESRLDFGRAIAAHLGERCVGVCNAAVPNMPSAAFERIVDELKRLQADGFVCAGGGSPIGLAKAVAAATKIPFIAVVTTYSGSEMSPRWYIGTGKDERTGETAAALPVTAIYDPDLTADLPFATTAASCMNAMAHAVESLYGPGLNPIVQTFAEEAIRRLSSALPRLKSDPKDREARTDALYGAWLAAAFRATTGIEHVIAQRIRQHFGTEHARTHAAVLPYAVAFNRDAAPDAMRRIAHALGVANPAQALYEINVGCGLATGLGQLGLRAEDIGKAADIVAARKFPNPRPASRDDIEALIRQAHAGRLPHNE